MRKSLPGDRTVVTVTRERVLTGHSGRLSLALSAGWLVIQLGRRALPPLLPAIIDDLAITPATAGFALSVMGALYATTHYPGGRLSDQLTRTTVLVGGMAAMVVGFLALSRVSSYYGFVFGVALVGLGAGFYMVPMRAFLSDLFIERRGLAFGINNAAGMAGSGAAAGLAVATLAVATWRDAFVPVALLLGLIALWIHLTSHESYALSVVDLDVRGTVGRVFRLPRIRWLVVAYSLYAFSWIGAITFLPTFLQTTNGVTPAVAGAEFALVFVVGTLVMPVAGRLGDRIDPIPVALASLGVCAIGLLVVLAFESLILLTVGVIAFAAGLMAFPPVMQAYLMGVFPDDSVGGDFGAFKTIYSGVGSLGPVYVGTIAEHSGYTPAYAGIVLSLLVAVAVVYWVARVPDGSG